MRLFKVSGYLSEADHLRLVNIAAVRHTTRTEIASLGIRAMLDDIENGTGVSLKRDRRIAANRKRVGKRKKR